MDLKNRIQMLCKQKGVTAVQVEQTLNFGKGYISKLNATNPGAGALMKLAEYFGVSVDYLLEGKEKAPAEDIGRREVSDDEMMFALWGDAEDVTEDDLEDVRRYAEFIRERKKRK